MSKTTEKYSKYVVTFADGKTTKFIGKSLKQIQEVIKAWNLKVKTIKPIQ